MGKGPVWSKKNMFEAGEEGLMGKAERSKVIESREEKAEWGWI